MDLLNELVKKLHSPKHYCIHLCMYLIATSELTSESICISSTISFPADYSPLEIVNRSVEVNERETIYLTCKCQLRLFSKLSWLKNGKNVSEGVMNIYDSQSSYVINSVLKINNAALHDMGNYSCMGQSFHGDTMSVHTIIAVKSKVIFNFFFIKSHLYLILLPHTSVKNIK